MKIYKKDLPLLCEEVYQPSRMEKRKKYHNMYRFYSGGGREIIKDTILSEFKDPKAVKDLLSRLSSVNIMKKVVNKLADVYAEDPVRAVGESDSRDEELLFEFVFATQFNTKQKQANRYLEAFGKNLKEIYPKNNKPFVKNLPPHKYEVFSKDDDDPNDIGIVCKIVNDDPLSEKKILHFWSDESFWICNGKGEVLEKLMTAKENPDGENIYGTLPFVFKSKSTDTTSPDIDDTLYNMSIALNVALTDLFFACKYQCWSIIYTIGVKGEINFNPSSVLALDYDAVTGGQSKPEIGQIKPTVDSDKAIKLIESALNFLLSSYGLSSGSVTLGSTASGVTSGLSKALDNAEVLEGKRDQQDDMLDDEIKTWDAVKILSNSWVVIGEKMLDPFNLGFSDSFYVSVSYKEPKVLLSDKDKLEISSEKIKQFKSSWTRELKDFYPDYTDDQIEDLKKEILDEVKQYPDIYKVLLGGSNGIQSKVSNKLDGDISEDIQE